MSDRGSEEYELSTVRASVSDDDQTSSSSSLLGYPLYANRNVLGRYIPEANPDHPRATSFLRKVSKRAIMIRIQLSLTASVAILNMVIWIWAAATHDVDPRGVGTLFMGDCSDTTTANRVSHLLLNALSTLFMGGASYCMQVLVAPSRADLETAHAVGDWLEIGVMSFKNLFKLRPWKVSLWLALGAISTVLHLVYVSIHRSRLDSLVD